MPYSDNRFGRRKFLRDSAGTFAAISLLPQGLFAGASNRNSPYQTQFEQKPLPYGYEALEPVIDRQTMEIHYTKHAAAYAKNLRDACAKDGVSTSQPLEAILKKISKYSATIRNNAGGHYNHEFFWQCMKATDPSKPNDWLPEPEGSLKQELFKRFGSAAAFRQQFSEAARNRFGSGWAWLYKSESGRLEIGSTPNQDNPLMDLSDIKGKPILALDVWEHAYYLKYQNKRADYIQQWWRLINWDFVQKRFDEAS